MSSTWPARTARLVGALVGALLLGSPATAEPASEQPPLHEQIDDLVAARLAGPVATRSSDAEFLRRVCLDLTGMVPTSAEARVFLDDPSPGKRTALIDRLLASPEYARRMQVVFDLMLMERRADQHVPAAEWREYLRASFAENRPYDELVREILSADGSNPLARPPAKFYLDRGGDPNVLARDVGRLFFGMDLGCAQCHDHPLIGDYHQWQYYGLFAFFSRSSVVTDKQQLVALGEKAEGDVTFQSVFQPEEGTKSTGPRLPDGRSLSEPSLAGELAYLVAPAEGVRPVPRYSRRGQLARQFGSSTPEAFNRNSANRLWALLWGRGLVEPVDLHHADNPPSNPELLDCLARQFAGSHYDVRSFLRELALSETYQRTSELPEGLAEPPAAESLAVAPLRPLSAEQLGWSLMQLAGIVPAERRAAQSAVKADRRLFELMQADPDRRRLESEWVERTVYEKLLGNLGQFISLFAPQPTAPTGDFEATVHQALFLANGATVRDWLAGEFEGSLLNRLSGLSDPALVADELFLSVVTRRPTPEEIGEVTAYLQGVDEAQRKQKLEELAWSLVASAEFRLNH